MLAAHVARRKRGAGVKLGWPKGLIFDLDGTLVDTAGDVAAVLNAVLAKERVSRLSEEEVERLMGGGIRALIEKALRARHRTGSQATVDRLYRRFLRIHSEHPLRSTKPFPHAAEVLSGLARRQIAIGVCTNKAEAPARLILERTGLATHVSALVGGDAGYGLKPDPRSLQACVEKLGLRAADVVYVGDHMVDVATARAADIPVIVVGYGYAGAAVSTLGADGSIDCMAVLPAELAGLEERRGNPLDASARPAPKGGTSRPGGGRRRVALPPTRNPAKARAVSSRKSTR